MGIAATDQEDEYLFNGLTLPALSEELITQHSVNADYLLQSVNLVIPRYLFVDEGSFMLQYSADAFPEIKVKQSGNQLCISCSCKNKKTNLCEHQSLVLLSLLKRNELRVFFDRSLRHDKLQKFALDYGLEHDLDLDRYFLIEYLDKKLAIRPILNTLLPVTKESLSLLKDQLTSAQEPVMPKTDLAEGSLRMVVLKQHKYYKHLFIEIYEAQQTKDGKIKNPLKAVNPLDLIWETDEADAIKFFTALSRFQNNVDSKVTQAAINSLKAIVKNPLNFLFYIHNSDVAESINALSVQSVQVSTSTVSDITLTVSRKGQFYEVTGSVEIGDSIYDIEDLVIKHTYFILIENTLYLIDFLNTLDIINFLKRKANHPLIHQSKYKDFKNTILSKLEERVSINYTDIEVASPEQIMEQGFNADIERIIFLSDFGQHVMLIPVIRYGEVEIPIRTRKQIFGEDSRGRPFLVQRDEDAEIQFTALLLKQHADFEEQMDNGLQYFFLHKKHFLNEDWFLKVFEDWKDRHITVLGFNEIEGNKLNANKVKISIQVLSGINWFNSKINVSYGSRKASLKQVHKAIRNKSKYVQLDDGTMGILPAEWIEKFTNYFHAGEVIDEETIRTPKINFSALAELYESDTFTADARNELLLFQKKLPDFEGIAPVEIPKGLLATLRPYQLQGLNWLNFLDDFSFGGCLADDMGLGKTLQIIAFILTQRTKVKQNTNLLVVPTSLIFNWQAEIEKFAPSIKLLTLYGGNRLKNNHEFDQYEVILTSYGSLLSDINFVKDYSFNYIFLDESQNIKNPESQRYKSVRLLTSRNKIAITGTPIENNTFDLYGQLSFACPGLLGSKQYFKDIYSSPIDKFKVSRRAAELQKKVKPFILRRTKQEVANELPDKTEMILYCEMQAEQRKVYDDYEREFREFISATDHSELPRKSMHVLKGLTKLRQICDSPLLLKGEKVKGDASCKIDTLIEQIETKSSRHKILIFSQFVTMLDLIRKKLDDRKIGLSYLTGASRNREVLIQEFQNNPEVRVFLISLKAGGTGLNLTAADYVYIVDPWWNPAVENQAIDRCYRIGQKKNVVAVRLICKDTIEEKIMDMQESKKGLMNELIRTDNGVKTLNKQDLLALLGV
ncbi:DEAD/DEAH box helicase-like protein [Arcticibacter svalbardensis MN12-7]|uniref:DEAD/DEAH box helicase-like protein n=1 Tax=Arcticibacter svalbardensis MN12-7 TaxID=1150600 RepID=R9GUJ6_9SPHI|nr:DEAD/DEAH box helicase [Arcticibacter svalbardensis]EOR95406.1 DEAD/DEAH box helicase-like protein [Arcticibacter svalbardensis MN12-7]